MVPIGGMNGVSRRVTEHPIRTCAEFSPAPEQNDVHLNVGFDVDTQHLGRSRVRYAVGVTLHVIDRVAFLVDFLGSSGVADETFTTGAGQTGVVARSDDVFAAPSLKIEISGSGVAFLGAVVPLTSNGLQARVLPAGGIEFTF
jgi:hypothetical protein